MLKLKLNVEILLLVCHHVNMDTGVFYKRLVEVKAVVKVEEFEVGIGFDDQLLVICVRQLQLCSLHFKGEEWLAEGLLLIKWVFRFFEQCEVNGVSFNRSFTNFVLLAALGLSLSQYRWYLFLTIGCVLNQSYQWN